LRPSSANNQRGFRIKKNTPPPKLNLEDEVYMQRPKTSNSTTKSRINSKSLLKVGSNKGIFGYWVSPGKEPDTRICYEYTDGGLAHYTGVR
jgi:hypothetical protein